MNFPDLSSGLIKITDCAFVRDGGSKILMGYDANNFSLEIVLAQKAFLEGNGDWIPGRLYINHHPVPIRSALETQVIKALKKAFVGASDLQAMTDEMIAFVESDEYVALGKKVDQLRK